jgi:NADH dehydrogenase
VLDAEGKPIDSVFAIGDNATPGDGTRLPATAQGESRRGHRQRQDTSTRLTKQVASQMAAYLVKAFNKTSSDSELAALPAFEWKNKGSMVFIGDSSVRPGFQFGFSENDN